MQRAGRAADEALFFASVSATRLPMVVTDPSPPDNGIVFANQVFLCLTGYRAGEVLGRNCCFPQGPETDGAVVARLREAISARRAVAAELLNDRRDGSSFWNALFVSPLFGRDGRLRYVYASQRDVSRHHDAEATLHQAQKMEARGQFSGSIGDDLNHLLQVITGYLDTLRRRLEARAEAEVAVALSTISAAAERGATLTRQLLGFARKPRLEGRVVNRNTLVEGIRPMAEKMAGRSVRLAHDVSKAGLNRFSPRRRRGALPGSVSPWPMASCASRTAGSRSPPRRAREAQ